MQAARVEESLEVGRGPAGEGDLVHQHGGVGRIHLRVREAVVSLDARHVRGEVARGAPNPGKARFREGHGAREPGLDEGLPRDAAEACGRNALVPDRVDARPNAGQGEIGEAEEIDHAADPYVADAHDHGHGGTTADAVGADACLVDLGVVRERGREQRARVIDVTIRPGGGAAGAEGPREGSDEVLPPEARDEQECLRFEALTGERGEHVADLVEVDSGESTVAGHDQRIGPARDVVLREAQRAVMALAVHHVAEHMDGVAARVDPRGVEAKTLDGEGSRRPVCANLIEFLDRRRSEQLREVSRRSRGCGRSCTRGERRKEHRCGGAHGRRKSAGVRGHSKGHGELGKGTRRRRLLNKGP